MYDSIVPILQQSGAIAVIPTDTVYGVVARAADKQAVQRLYELKRRENKPGTIIAASMDQLEVLGLKHRYLKAVEQYWPGPLSVVIPCGPELQYLHDGAYSLAVRLPKHEALQALLAQTGPLLTSSANDPGQPTAATTNEAKSYFHDHVDAYVDGGDLSGNRPSTIIRIVDDAVQVLRQGAVRISESNELLQ